MSLMLFRTAQASDLQAIYHLALESGVGITTLPKDLDLLEKRIRWSTKSLQKTVENPGSEYYLFVLEDPEQNRIVGTSAIEASTGHNAPFYSYKLSKITRAHHELKIHADYEILTLVNDYQGHSEICTLYLDPHYRRNGNGLLLSRARFLFIAAFRKRFAEIIIAEMRGIFDEQGHSPFWESIGHHFFHMAFSEADHLTVSTNKQFIADLMPSNPIYVNLLSTKAQEVIGKPHPSALPAMTILLREGFRYNHYVDIFDGGPTIEVPRDNIATIASAKLAKITSLTNNLSTSPSLLANTNLEFRATIGPVIYHKNNNSCTLSEEAATLLKLKCGDFVHISEG